MVEGSSMTIWGSNGFGRRGRAIGRRVGSADRGRAGRPGRGRVRQQRPGSGGGGTAASSGDSLAGQTITLYNGQHEQTTDALVAAFEKQTGVKVKVRNDDEDVLAQQIEQEGCTRRPTSSTPRTPRRWSGWTRRACWPRSTRRRWPRCRPGQRHRPQLGRGLGPGQRAGLQHRRPQPAAAADLGARPGRPEVEGQARHRPVRDRLPAIVTSVAADIGDAATVTWLKALKANAGAHQTPTTRRWSPTSTRAPPSSA